MYDPQHGLYVAHGPEGPISICGKMANRHGLIAGATGTGKTVTLQVLAETFSQAGVPCFMADMKGDLSGISQTGAMSGFIEKRCAEFGISNPAFGGCPVQFFDVFGEQGHPMRTTVSNMGPQLLSRLLGLSEVQSGVLDIVFRVADERGLLLLDMKDLRSMLGYVAEHAAELQTNYGNVTSASVGAIQRALLSLESQGAEKFFGEPAFDIFDLFQTRQGKGVMSVLAADRLMLNPKLYSTFLLWLLSDIYAQLPEVGDLDLPKLVFFFDEAHLLFNGASKALLEKIEQAVKLIRSKGVGIYFCTQNPRDIPDNVLAQLNNKIEHGLRAYTPNEQKAVRAIADAFRENPAFDTFDTILNLGTGEALVSVLDADGVPTIGEKVSILPPRCSFGSLSDDTRDQLIKASLLYSKYYQAYDPDSAFEFLQRRGLEDQRVAEASAFEAAAAKEQEQAMKEAAKEQARIEKEQAKLEREAERERQRRMRPLINAGSSAAGSIGRDIGKALGKATGNKNLERAAGNAVSTL
ncbi:MAG: DUF853 family protein, partial [Bacteroidales bacterium]|nr:DUF853 family protein [Bacteroidales bacterium]